MHIFGCQQVGVEQGQSHGPTLTTESEEVSTGEGAMAWTVGKACSRLVFLPRVQCRLIVMGWGTHTKQSPSAGC